jgi:hypothetical protein
VYRTRSFQALAFRFSLTVDTAELAEYFDWLFAAFPEPAVEAPTFVVEQVDVDGATKVQLRRGDEVFTAGSTGPSFIGFLMQWINQRATRSDLVIASHAGGVARDERACVLPAHMESGKTTLTTGLVRSGFSYVTDEAVAFQPDGWITPYAKPLSIDPGSHFLFPGLEPPLPPGLPAPEPTAGAHQWQVPPSMVRDDAVASQCRAALLVFPRYEAERETELHPMTRGEALVELAKNTFHFRDRPRYALDVLTPVVEGADCYRLTVGDLDDACAVVDELMAKHG